MCEFIHKGNTDSTLQELTITEDQEILSERLLMDEVLDKLEEELAHFVTFAFCDIEGNLKEIIIPVDQAKTALRYGLSLSENNLLIKPDLHTLRFLPWTTDIHRTAWFMCTVYKNQLEPYEADPRAILAALTKNANNLGYTFNAGIELDFFLLEKNEQGSLVPSDQVNYLDPEHNLTKQQEINLIIHALRDFNIDIEKIDHGIANGQWRITLKSGNALQIADNTISCKYALKVLTKQLRQHITFMPKPFYDKNANKMQINYTLFDIEKNKNAFYDTLDPFKLSVIAKQFLAGNLERAIETSSLFSSTINSYKQRAHELQAYNCWSPSNYNTMFNSIITNQDEREERLYLKTKIADCTSNIYLLLSALLKSGMHGIKNVKLLGNPIDEGDINNNGISPEQVDFLNLTEWPTNLSEALTMFEKSNFTKQLLSTIGHSKYTELKQAELREYNSCITDWELKKYL